MNEATVIIPGESTSTKFIDVDETRTFLIGEEITKSYDSVYLQNPETGGRGKFLQRQNEKTTKKTVKYPLTKVDKLQLKVIRDKEINATPAFILKDNNNYYYCEIPIDSVFIDCEIDKRHKCGRCDRLSGLPYELGGCDKVRDKGAKVENYPFIIFGYETINFGAIGDQFVVAKCACFKPYPKKKEISTKESNRRKFSLAQFFLGVDSPEEAALKIKSNFSSNPTVY